MVTSLLDRSEVIIRPIKDGDGETTFELGLIVTNGIQTPKTKPPKLQARVAPDGLRNYSAVSSQKPSRTKEPPIPGPSPSSKPPEDVPTHEPKPEVAHMQSTEEPYACPATPRSIIIIDDTPVRSPHPSTPTPVPSPENPNSSSPPLPLPPRTQPPPPRCQAPLIPTMMLARNSPTCDRP
ncbi:hypothetical protein O181_132116 [Austropuccinia psidii MF-1]|uniref:Uncharacterized protein n=1 Tax=Austropuccinia psidii MF-1 TaxID=1389203 RepID=A0A9Q3QAX0_9BASI|nr:hypothetical protein [Austropuccinia psidii MF-1]